MHAFLVDLSLVSASRPAESQIMRTFPPYQKKKKVLNQSKDFQVQCLSVGDQVLGI